MADRPIIFSAPMVRALLDGRKTQTRRVLSAKSGIGPAHTVQRFGAHWLACEFDRKWPLRLPYAPGDRLWVREAWTARMIHGWTIADARSGMFQEEILYRAYGDDSIDGWWPSIHMPREFSRLTLTVTDVRVQRVQDISNENAIAEGIEPHGHAFTGYGKQADVWMAPYDSFASLWNSIHGPGAWDANPWVAAITFTVRKGNIDHD